MEKMFCLGLALGMVGGALIVANNYKARSLVKKSQQELTDKLETMMDEKLQAMGGNAQNQQGAANQQSQQSQQSGAASEEE
jgi:hypothetical protein